MHHHDHRIDSSARPFSNAGCSRGLWFRTGGWSWTELAKENQTGAAGPGVSLVPRSNPRPPDPTLQPYMTAPAHTHLTATWGVHGHCDVIAICRARLHLQRNRPVTVRTAYRVQCPVATIRHVPDNGVFRQPAECGEEALKSRCEFHNRRRRRGESRQQAISQIA